MPEGAPIESARTKSSAAPKRERTRTRLLANAIALFREQGVEPTRLADVARASDVAPATLYNHFPSRAALAGAWVRGEIESAAEEVGRAVRLEERGLRASVRSLCRTLAERNAEDAVVRWSAWQEATRVRTTPSAGLRDAFAIEQQREHVRGDQSPESLADLLTDAIEGGLVEGLRAVIDGRDDDARARARTIAASLQTRVDLVLDGARKRNERVRPGAIRTPR